MRASPTGSDLARVEFARDDDALAGRPSWVARRERQRRHRRVGRGDHLVVVRRHDLLAGDDVDEAAGRRGDDDVVTRLQLLDAVERLAVGRAVTGDRRVAELSGHGRLRIVTWPLLQIGLLHPGNHDLVDPDPRDLQAGDGIALLEGGDVLLGDRDRLGDGHGGSNGVRRRRIDRNGVVGDHDRRRGARWWCGAGEQVVEFVLEGILRSCRLDARSPELVRDESEHEQPGGDEHLAEATDEEPPVVGRLRTVELVHLAGAGSWGRRPRMRPGGWVNGTAGGAAGGSARRAVRLGHLVLRHRRRRYLPSQRTRPRNSGSGPVRFPP